MKRLRRRAAMGVPAVLLALQSVGVRAGEMLVQGQVVDVVPLAAAPAFHDCQPPRPGRSADLMALLRWDLRADCHSVAGPSGYRVYYRWDGRTYSRDMAQPPGDTVTLRVRVR